MDELISLLTRRRLLLERLLYRLSISRNFMVGGQPRFLAWAAAEIETASTDVRNCDLMVETVYQSVADKFGLPEAYSWDALIETADSLNPASASLLRKSRIDIGNIVAEVRATVEACKTIGENQTEFIGEALSALQGIDPRSALPAAHGHTLDPVRHLNQTL